MTISTDELAAVCGGADDHPNDRTVNGTWYTAGGTWEPTRLRCWDSSKDPSTTFCVPESWIGLPGGRGNPMIAPKSWIEQQSK